MAMVNSLFADEAEAPVPGEGRLAALPSPPPAPSPCDQQGSAHGFPGAAGGGGILGVGGRQSGPPTPEKTAPPSPPRDLERTGPDRGGEAGWGVRADSC